MGDLLKRSSLKRLYQFANIVIIVTLFLIVAVSLSNLHRAILLSDNIVEKSLNDIHHAMALRLALNRFEMPVNDYIIRANVEEIEKYRLLRDEVIEQFKQLARSIQGQPGLSELLNRVLLEWNKANVLAGVIIQTPKPVGNPDTIEYMRRFNTLVDHSVDMLNGLYEQIYNQTAASRDQLHKIEQQAIILVLILSALGLIVVILGSIKLARMFFPPLNRMLTGIRLFGLGRLDHRINSGMPVEFAELADGINSMAEQLDDIYTELKQSSIHDPLTGCLNRRKLDEDIMKAFSQAKRSDVSLSVLMLDLDLFKNINDAYGHPAGDVVLCSVAELARDQLRAHESLYRFGGEEFLIILPATSALDASVLAERIRSSIEKKKIDVGSDELASVTASIGISSYPQALSTKELIGMADKALYSAKNEGRNRVVVSS